jgi:hypothetical protein
MVGTSNSGSCCMAIDQLSAKWPQAQRRLPASVTKKLKLAPEARRQRPDRPGAIGIGDTHHFFKAYEEGLWFIGLA